MMPPIDAPLDGDEALAFEDTPDSDARPAELDDARNHLVFDRFVAKRRDEATFAKRLDKFASVVDDDTAVLGRIVREATLVDVDESARDSASELEPFIPKWSGVSFAPRLAANRRTGLLRRRDGTIVNPEVVFPPDSRVPYYPSTYPWRIVGKLLVWSDASAPAPAWSGTGSLVGRNVVLTASHVVPWGSGSNWKALFVPAYYDGASVMGSGAASWVVQARGYRSHSQGDDMAVMRLDRRLGDWLGYFGYKTYDDDWEDGAYWTLPGYPGDRSGGQRPHVHSWFPITDDDSDGAGVELEYKADTYYGNSGSPVFGWWRGAPHIVGTHSGSEDNWFEPHQNVAAGGSALSSLIGWARNNW